MRGSSRITGHGLGPVTASFAVAVPLAAAAVTLREVSRPFLPSWTLGAAAWWPAAGIALVVLARGPRRWWPAVLTASATTSLAGYILDNVAGLQAVALTAANLVGITLAACVLTGWRTHRPTLVSGFGSQMRVVLALAVGLAGTAVIAAAEFSVAGGSTWVPLRSFLLAHALVLTTFAPLLLQDFRSMLRQLANRRRNAEWAMQFAQSIVLADLIFVNGRAPTYGFVLFLPLLWGAAQLGPLRMTITMIATFGIALGGVRWTQTATSTAGGPELAALLCLLITMAAGVVLMLMAAQEQRQATERAQAGQARLQESEERFRLSFDSASVGMYTSTLDPDRYLQVIRVNAALCEFLGRPAEQLVGCSAAAFSQDLRDAEQEVRELTLRGDDLSQWRREVRFTHADGSTVHGLVSCSVVRPQFDVPYVVAQVVDITARKQAEERLRHLALHDPLTGLPNRALLSDRTAQALSATARTGHSVGLLFCDLDGFKQVNDSAGHSAGDELLEQAALRLEAVIRPGDTVARLGGDEFAILCADLADSHALETVATRALAALRAPFDLQAGSFTISASIGACLSDPEGDSPERLLHQADAAMYTAKRAGKDRFSVSGEVEQSRARRESWLRPALETALRDGELVMFGQPIVELDTGAIRGVETLLRWQHRERGMLTPGYFLDVAENSPLMVPIGRRVLDESCRLAAGWAAMLGSEAPDVHVNVSGRQLSGEGFARDVLDALARHGLAPQRLVLELTETHMPLMVDSLRADIMRLRELGIRFAIDDIGTGYSSLARLTELPVDVLKIDMKFVSGLGVNPSCDAVVRAVLAIGRTLGGDVVAEGVETSAQKQRLQRYGCRLVQGFLLARPLPETALALTLESNAADRSRGHHNGQPRPILPARG